MKVLILDTLLKQASNNNADHSKLTREVINRIHNEYGNLASLEKAGRASLMAYINRQNGKPMLSVKDVYKYRLTDGDRIIYTHGDVIGYLSPEDKDSIVLLAYAKHDEQGAVAKRVAQAITAGVEHDYVSVNQFVQVANECEIELDAKEFNEDDYNLLYNFLLDPTSVQAHRILVVPDDEYLDLDADMQDVALSETQSKVVQAFNNKPVPTLILGGAGTGKTVICMHVLNDFDNSVDGQTGIYFTQSKELLGKVEQKLKYLPESPNTNDILEYDINDFGLEQIQESRKHLVETRQFIGFLSDNESLYKLCIDNAIEPLTIWTEIRGTIKGYMGRQWIRTAPMNQSSFKGSIESLVAKGYFVRERDDKRKITLADSVTSTVNKCNLDEGLTASEKSNIKIACEHFSKFDGTIISLTKEQYNSLDEEDSTIERTKRETVWAVFEAYQEWMESNGLFDENDLVLKVIKHCGTDMPECNLAVVDEVQDYTELQIFLLCKLVTASNGKIIFAGDVNQNVNPTYFSEDHLKLLFTNDDGKSSLNIEHLTANFRCSQQIVNVANSISRMRRQSIAAHGLQNESDEHARRDGVKPYRLQNSSSNIKQLLDTMMAYPRVALLVPDLATKNNLIDIIGAERYERDSVAHFIFTVNEIKGMEYAYVVCYNLSSFYKDIWEQILNSRVAKRQTKYRYYFNLLYVATTRAEKYLCFIDDKLVEKLEAGLNLENISRFDAAGLYFTSLSNTSEEQLRQAKEFFDSGHYEDALHIYSRVGQAEDMYKCKLRIAEEQHAYEEALKYHMLINPWDAYGHINEVDTDSELKLMHDAIYVNPQMKRGSGISFSKVISKYYSDDEKQLNDMQDMMFERLSVGLTQGIEVFDRFNFYSGV